jgi:hypothetical protein
MIPPAPPLGHFADPLVGRLYRYWDERRQGRGAPSRADIDPIDFAFILADVCLIEVVAAGVADAQPRFLYRIVGDNLVQWLGFSMRGRWLDELPGPELRERVRRSFVSVLRTRAPRHGVRDSVLDDRLRRYEFMILPLSSDGERVDMLLTVQRELR